MADLSKSRFLSEIKSRLRENEALLSSVLNTIHQACSYACERSKLILKTMPEYTLHDETHLSKVLSWMERLISDELLNQLSVPELMLMVLSAYMHDLGMAPSEEEYAMLRGGVDEQSLTEDQKNDIRDYCSIRDTILSKGGTEKYSMVEFIRNTHAKRIRRILNTEYPGEIKYASFDLKTILADICASHNENIETIKGNAVYLMDGEPVCIHFLKVMLRLADILDFDCERAPEILFRILSIENELSRKEWEKHRAIQNISIEGNSLCLSAVCKKPNIEYAVRSFAKVIEDELIRCRAVVMDIHDPNVSTDKYKKANIPMTVDCSRVKADVDLVTGRFLYRYYDLHFNLNKDKIITLLMSDIYGGDEVELRELLQNAIDTTMLRKKISDARRVEYTPQVIVSFNSQEHSLSVEDNGMGMDVEDLHYYYSSIGTSYYKSSDYKALVSRYSVSYHPISRFGIGVLSCFMASNTIEFETRKFIPFSSSKEPIHVTIQGKDEIFYIVDGTRDFPGTKTTLKILPGRKLYSVGEEEFLELVRNTVLCPPFDIIIQYDGRKCIHGSNALRDINLDLFFKDNNWESVEDCYSFELDIDDNTHGIVGKARMMIIEHHGMPVRSLDYPTKSVTVDGMPYDVHRDLHYGENVILEGSSELGFNGEDEVDVHHVSYWKFHSKGTIALHGMTIRHNLFPDNSIGVGATLQWPFPLQLVLNCGDNCDLDIDSSRGKIIAGKKWEAFEQRLAFIIFENLFKLRGIEYAKRLLEVCLELHQERHNRYSTNLFLGIEDAFNSCFGCNP